MRYTFEEEFRIDHPETIGETDKHYDLSNYRDWLERKLFEALDELDNMFTKEELNIKLEQQKEEIRQWLINEDFEGLAERI